MTLFRDEIHRTAARLRLIRNELLEKGLTGTAETLNQAIQSLENADKTYITELANKKQHNSGK